MFSAPAEYAGMLAIFAVSFIGGFCLGLRFRVLVLIPVIVVGIVLIVSAGFGLRVDTWPIVVASFIHAVSTQIGYFLGISAVGVLRRKTNGERAGVVSSLNRAAPPRGPDDQP